MRYAGLCGLCLVLPLAALAAEPAPAGADAVQALSLRLRPDRTLDLRRSELRTDVTGSRVRLLPQAGPPISFILAERLLRTGGSADSGLLVPRPELPFADPDAWRAQLPTPPTSLTQSGDGRLVLAVLSDGTLRWYAAATGQPLLSLFLHPDRKRWIAWTPSGFYDASAGGDDLLGWELPRGPGLPPDFFRIRLFRDRFYRPDLISRILFIQDEARALEEFDAESGRKEPAVPLRRVLPPLVRFLEPAPGTVVRQNRLLVRFTVRSPSGEPVTGVRVLARGMETQSRGVRVQAPLLLAGSTGPDEPVRSALVDLPAEDATVAVMAETALAQSEPALLPLRWGGPRGTGPTARPDLYLLAIGISEYRDRRLRLDYAAKDARDLAAAFQAQQGRRYRRVETRVLADGLAGREAIAAGLQWLRKSATAGDVAAVFLAGHGITDPQSGKYYFVPQEGEPGRPETLLGGEALRTALGQMAGKALLFLDTCHAGKVDLTRLASEMASEDSGVVVYAASTGNQVSRESPRWSNGAFTKAAVEGLRGQADYRGSGEITVSALETYISARVKELTQEQQVPTSAKPGTVPDFLVATTRARYRLERKWWFWGAMGVVAAGIVTGALLGTEPWNTPPTNVDVPGFQR